QRQCPPGGVAQAGAERALAAAAQRGEYGGARRRGPEGASEPVDEARSALRRRGRVGGEGKPLFGLARQGGCERRRKRRARDTVCPPDVVAAQRQHIRQLVAVRGI